MVLEFDSEGKVITPIMKILFTKEELLEWKRKYDSEEDQHNKGDEERIGEKLRKNKFMTKKDFIEILKWKFQGRLLGRQKIMLNVLGDFPTEKIEKISKEAFSSNNNYERLELLSEIPAVQNSLASVILTFYDPENYGILDIHTWRELFGPEPQDIFTNRKKAVGFFKKIQDLAKSNEMTCRDIEKALFKKNLDDKN